MQLLLNGENLYIGSKIAEGNQIFEEATQRLLALQKQMKVKQLPFIASSITTTPCTLDIEGDPISESKHTKVNRVTLAAAAVFIAISTTLAAIHSQKSYWGF